MQLKRLLLGLLIAMSIVLGACGADSDKPQQDNTQTPAAAPAATPVKTPEATPTPTPAPTPAPDFSETDFTGRWRVSEVIDSEGQTVRESEMQSLNIGFMLELLENGIYFVYEEDGDILGQGEYSITRNQLTLTASDQETVYEIRDQDTLWCESADKSVTVMTRVVDDNTETDNEPDNEPDGEDGEDDSDDASQA